ncbi:hypothetical protein HAP48_0024540 [Bradyrhizobium septentrionale]|uniref:Uncharacterized protein n=1 Tax=Bradyrhizobium septentrionale TaxID=1404411 RepID=A0A973VW04_9BRAD|nr:MULTISPECIES: hypothetical protein [Bradyrhizobium]MCK7672696.1 hypothetical protein [Bradyrhizobium sp. 2S1]UGY20302.1 hypothetical protein HAP48_0024540 [Bradyrhizobium septentrionale]UGY29133.1 hypothetical protein HU675_0021800 [Bradyrhizobium septentrionale]
MILVDLSLMLLAPQKAEAINIGAGAHFISAINAVVPLDCQPRGSIELAR